jgi:heme iron utilization protein
MDEQKSQTATAVRALLQNAKTASLAVIDPDRGGPYVSLVNVACENGITPLFLLSDLARHTRALSQDPRASLLLNADLPKSGDALTALRATVSGLCEKIEDEKMMVKYLSHHPHAKGYAEFGDFNLWCLKPEIIFVVGGFGRIYQFDPKDILQSI